MKRLFSLLIVSVIGFALSAALLVAGKKTMGDKAADATKKAVEKPATAAKEAPAKIIGEGKALPMRVRADVIDPKARTFTMKKKDGTEVRHVLTDATTIINGEAPAKLDDIKVGEWVNGLRRKKSDTEYEVVKITKFGPGPGKKPKADAVIPAEVKKSS